jgi:hypothetical protein
MMTMARPVNMPVFNLTTKLAALIGLALLSGCGAADRAEATQKGVELAACKQQFDHQHMVNRTNCTAAVIEAHMHLVRYPDLQRLILANDAVVAAKVDSGQITYAEGTMLHAQLSTQVAAEEERRNAVRAEANAATIQASAALLAAQPQPVVYQPPVYQPHNISCARFGNITNCNEQ